MPQKLRGAASPHYDSQNAQGSTKRLKQHRGVEPKSTPKRSPSFLTFTSTSSPASILRTPLRHFTLTSQIHTGTVHLCHPNAITSNFTFPKHSFDSRPGSKYPDLQASAANKNSIAQSGNAAKGFCKLGSMLRMIFARASGMAIS